MRNTVVGVFDSRSRAEEAIEQLRYHGFDSENIDLSYSDNTGEMRDRAENTDKISRFFKHLFGDTDEANDYGTVAQRGAVVTVHAASGEDAERASSIMDQYGAMDAREQARRYRQPEYRENRENISGNIPENAPVEGRASIPVIEEQMEVGKREVEKDRVRIRSRVVERPVEEQLRLRSERVFVERTPADRAATEADMKTFREGVIEATEKEEIPVVKKEARVVEDVKLKKEVREREQTIRGSVRKQDVDVDKKKRDRETSSDADDTF